MRRRVYVVSAIAIALLAVIALVWSRRTRRKGADAEDAALEAFSKLRASGDRAAALDVLVRCTRRDRAACRCSDLAGEFAVDTGQYANAWRTVLHSQCENTARHLGQRAEILVAYHLNEQGTDEAKQALAIDPREPHANFALAWALSASGSPPAALDAAEKAVAGGRGVPAMLLLGTLRSGAGDGAGARDVIEQAARLAPADPRVAYDFGVVEQAAGNYRAAREAYLRALRAEPKLADAHYNLAILTHSIKADDEARHDLDELIATAPGDPRIPGLRALLSVDATDAGAGGASDAGK